ncbi:MAG: hypothetical protein WCW52_03020 [Elusimicrobiales bacterium]|jgi:hypothetical protein
MHCYHQTKLIFLLLAACGVLCGCRKAEQRTDTWTVLLSDLPVRLFVADAGLNGTFYLLKQTHEPLFRQDDGEIFSSRLLEKWSRDIRSSEYLFCPDTSLRFDADNTFSMAFFYKYIRKTAKAFDQGAEVEKHGECVRIKLGSHSNFLAYLSLFENAPTLKRTEKIEVGLGAFSVETLSAEKVVLKRKQRVSNGYNAIVFHQYKGGGDPNLQNRQISDFNNIPSFEIPEWVKKDYRHFDSPILRSISLIINYPDKAVRKAVYNCLNYDSLRRAYVPRRKNFYDICNILPVGVPGAEAGPPRQECYGIARINRHFELTFLNLAYNNDKTLKEVLSAFHKRTGIKIVVRTYPDNQIDAALLQSPRRYNLAIVVMDAVRPNHEAFFDYLIKKNGYFDTDNPALTHLYEKMLKEPDEEKKNSLAKVIAEKLDSEALVLPLYQNVATFYYPRNIKSIILGRGFIEYPEVAEFRW